MARQDGRFNRLAVYLVNGYSELVVRTSALRGQKGNLKVRVLGEEHPTHFFTGIGSVDEGATLPSTVSSFKWFQIRVRKAAMVPQTHTNAPWLTGLR